MPKLTIVGGWHYVFRSFVSLSGHLFIVRQHLHREPFYLCTIIHHVSGHILKGFQGRVKGRGHSETKCNFAAVVYISMAWYQGSLVSD